MRNIKAQNDLANIKCLSIKYVNNDNLLENENIFTEPK